MRVIIAGAVIASCTPQVRNHGHLIDDRDIAQVEVGRTSREEVYRLLGSPSTVATFDDRRWFYISQRTEQSSFYQKDVVAQDVVTISFGPRGLVENVETKDIQEARAVDPDPNETRTLGNELSVVEQFIGNIGRFNPEGAEASEPR